jgi:DNA-binding transcriptional LysR family regulator
LHDDLYDVGFSIRRSGRRHHRRTGLEKMFMVAVPARHPLLAYKRIPLEEVLRYPLVLGDPQVCEGHAKQIDRILRKQDMEPLVAERRYVRCDDGAWYRPVSRWACGRSAHCRQPRTGRSGRPLAGACRLC